MGNPFLGTAIQPLRRLHCQCAQARAVFAQGRGFPCDMLLWRFGWRVAAKHRCGFCDTRRTRIMRYMHTMVRSSDIRIVDFSCNKLGGRRPAPGERKGRLHCVRPPMTPGRIRPDQHRTGRRKPGDRAHLEWDETGYAGGRNFAISPIAEHLAGAEDDGRVAR